MKAIRGQLAKPGRTMARQDNRSAAPVVLHCPVLAVPELRRSASEKLVHRQPKKPNTMPRKQSSSSTSSLASKVLSGAKKPTIAETKKLAASVLGQDEKKGQGKK
jgi:hypothetical protein